MTPTDADFDNMHHALGRPDGPHVTPYRNYFAIDADSPTAQRFEALGLWLKGRQIGGGLVAYHVTDEGQRLTMTWMTKRQAAQGLRPWIVSGREIATRTVIAKSRRAAVYHVFLEVSDAWSISFRDFLRLDVRARTA